MSDNAEAARRLTVLQSRWAKRRGRGQPPADPGVRLVEAAEQHRIRGLDPAVAGGREDELAVIALAHDAAQRAVGDDEPARRGADRQAGPGKETRPCQPSCS